MRLIQVFNLKNAFLECLEPVKLSAQENAPTPITVHTTTSSSGFGS